MANLPELIREACNANKTVGDVFTNLGIGDVRYVCITNSNAHTWLKDHVDPNMIYHATNALGGTAIQTAIDDSKGGTNTYILVFAGNYALTTAITMAGKSSMHLIGVNGYGMDVGCLGAAALTQGGNYENVIMEAYGELAGFQIINKAGYAAVTMADGKWRANIHNNYFHMTQGTACSIIKCLGSGMSHGNISRNLFQTWVGGSITSAISTATATAVTISKNYICNYSGTMDVGITVSGAQCFLLDNIISDCGGAGVITLGMEVGTAYSTVIGNRIQLPIGTALNGGTANRSFVDNRDAESGGNVCIET